LTPEEALAANPPPPTVAGGGGGKVTTITSYYGLIFGLISAVIIIACCVVYAIYNRRSRQFHKDDPNKELQYWQDAEVVVTKDAKDSDMPANPVVNSSRKYSIFDFLNGGKDISDGEESNTLESMYGDKTSLDMANPLSSRRNSQDSESPRSARVSSVNDVGLNFYGMYDYDISKIGSRIASVSSAFGSNFRSQIDVMDLANGTETAYSENGSAKNRVSLSARVDENDDVVSTYSVDTSEKRRRQSIFEGRLNKTIVDDLSIDTGYRNTYEVTDLINPMRDPEGMKIMSQSRRNKSSSVSSNINSEYGLSNDIESDGAFEKENPISSRKSSLVSSRHDSFPVSYDANNNSNTMSSKTLNLSNISPRSTPRVCIQEQEEAL
jgi:hypothetical protein